MTTAMVCPTCFSRLREGETHHVCLRCGYKVAKPPKRKLDDIVTINRVEARGNPSKRMWAHRRVDLECELGFEDVCG